MVECRELMKIIQLMPVAQEKLRNCGLTNEANFLKANENLLRDYFKLKSTPLASPSS